MLWFLGVIIAFFALSLMATDKNDDEITPIWCLFSLFSWLTVLVCVIVKIYQFIHDSVRKS